MDQRIWTLIVVLLGLAIAKLFRTLRSRRPDLPLPPGPPQRFWSGNLHQHPKTQPWLMYASWAKIYGPIVHFRIFSENIIVLNSAKAALDLLESRAAIYSDRPYSYMFNDLLGRKLNVFRVPYSHPRLKIQNYRPIQEQETRQLLKVLAETPENFIAHLRRFSGALILNVIYGYNVSGDNDLFVKNAEAAFTPFQAERLARLFMVDYFPILRFVPAWFPFAEFKRTARELRGMRAEEVLFEWAKKSIASDNHVDSFISRFLRPDDGPLVGEEEQDIIKWVTGGLYIGGSATTPSVMTSFMLLMSLYPDVQKLAQAGIDNVVGRDRLPSVNDRERMPYMSAFIKEVLRWAWTGPLGFRHRVMEDDVYEGYSIPKGTTIIANIWAITHDPELYPDPFTSDPSRHLGDNAQPNPLKFVFGFGRRVCPGAHLAEVSLFLNMTNILAAFNISKEVDKDGREIEPDVEWIGGAPEAHLKPFKCRIVARSSFTSALIYT